VVIRRQRRVLAPFHRNKSLVVPFDFCSGPFCALSASPCQKTKQPDSASKPRNAASRQRRPLARSTRRRGCERLGNGSSWRSQPLRYLHDCSDCFRLERLPGGACTHWKAPPLHGARQKRSSGLLNDALNILHRSARLAATASSFQSRPTPGTSGM
jgi:hypothetical protein